jgi:hypothetical protein
LDFLKSVADTSNGRSRTTKSQVQTNNHYRIEAFLVRHGRLWDWRPLPKGIKAGGDRYCYKYATDIALKECGYVYCEGFAFNGVLPVEHAWCVDGYGKVMDPTWDRLNRRQPVVEYFGVAVKTEFLRALVLETGAYCGVLKLPRQGCPILSAPIKDWFHPVNKRRHSRTGRA